jgi:hypothetical protein
VSLTTVGAIILILLILDVLFTLGFAALAGSVAGRSSQDYDIPFLGAAANHLYNRLGSPTLVPSTPGGGHGHGALLSSSLPPPLSRHQ